MILHDSYIRESLTETTPAVRFGLSADSREDALVLLTEHRMDIVINDVPTYRLNCTPDLLPELVIGRLCSDGIIRNAEDISYLSICRHGNTANVYLSPSAVQVGETGVMRPADREAAPANGPAKYIEETPTCCTDNHMLNRDFVREDRIPEIAVIDWKPEWIYACAETFQKDTPLHKETRSTHSCFLCRNGEILFAAEDIGRHNALDKAIGYALLKELPLPECYLYTSGRVPTDMMRKVLLAGIPLFISKELPTTDAVELASRHGITLIGKARPDSFLQF